MIEELNKIIEIINSKTDWDKNTKIRFAYVELGRLIHNDIFFFYTIQNNLLNGKEELQYDIDTIDKIINGNNNFDYKVICKSSAEMLKYIFDHTGIECEVKKTTRIETYKDNDREIPINHYFIVVTGNDDKKYFMTLNPDLYNIQIGKKTSHFGNNINYIQTEKYIDENGETKTRTYHAYEGEEIHNTFMTPEEIQSLDEKIGYKSINYNGRLVYTDDLFDILEKNYRYDSKTLNDGKYIDIVRCETPFYYDVCRLLNKENTLEEILLNEKIPTKEEIDDSYIDYEKISLNEKDLKDLKLFILLEVIMRLYNKYNIDIDEYILDNFRFLLEEKNYDKLQENVISNFYDKDVTKLGPHNPIIQFKKTIRMLKTMDDLVGKEKNTDSIKKLIESIKDVSFIFVPDEYLPSSGERLNSSYLTNKIIKSFEQVFDIGHIGEFNSLETVEQITIIKELLTRIFTDSKLNYQDKTITGYREDKSPLNNRLFQTVLFDKETHYPYYLLIVRNSLEEKERKEGLVPIIFDLKRNTLHTDKSMIDIYDSFYIIKDNDFRLMIEQIEKDNTKSI